MAAPARTACILLALLTVGGAIAVDRDADGSLGAEAGLDWEDAAVPQRQLLIVNGRDAPCGNPARFPYMASLQNENGIHTCGAVLVGDQWLVTAAHCVDPDFKDNVGRTPTAVIGACILDEAEDDENAQVVQVQTSVMHPMYSGNITEGYDVAMLKLSEVSTINFPVLPETDDDTLGSENLVVLGWGAQADGNFANRLQMADEVDLIAACDGPDAWKSLFIPEQMICAKGSGGQDICDGDGGGPLISAFAPEGVLEDGVPIVDIVLGVVSFAENKPCGERQLPTIFARLSGVREWILDTMEDGGDTP